MLQLDQYDKYSREAQRVVSVASERGAGVATVWAILALAEALRPQPVKVVVSLADTSSEAIRTAVENALNNKSEEN